ncbi:IS630 family transposase [Streptomyces sannanensis]|uniref:IS630 family transposase n=1 Tax=Streptomyces sannanensis TaxID=285536 RepID=UPI003CD055CB
MRYPDGGGLTAGQRKRREEVRIRAADLYEEGVEVPCIARELRVSEKSVYQWRRAWESGGREALRSKGPSGYDCRLGPHLQAKLAAWLEEGPAAHGWTDDQVWTAARVRTLIGRKFHISYSVSGVTRLLHRMGYSVQMPARPATERDEDAVTAWREATWQEVKAFRAATGAFICLEDEAGVTGRPPKGRTWGRRGITPTVRVSGRSRGRLSVAGLLCFRPGLPARLCYRLRRHTGRKGERRSLSETDCIRLPDGAHQLLKAPLIVVWDRLSTHTSKTMQALVAEREWLTVILLPGYAPDLNPVEGLWAHIKRSLANLAARTLSELETLLRRRLKALQYRHTILDGFLAGTGLARDRPN